jgi:membrane protein required for colicin V production
MVLDIIGITLVIIFFIRGYMKGIIVAAFSVLAILLGVICSLKLSQTLASYILEKGYASSGWAPLIAYVVLFIIVVLLVRLIAKAFESSAKAMMMGWVNSSIGGFLYAFLAAVIWSSFLWLGNEMSLISEATIQESKTYSYAQPIAPWLFDKVGKIWPDVKNVFGNLQTYFDSINPTAPTHVDTPR